MSIKRTNKAFVAVSVLYLLSLTLAVCNVALANELEPTKGKGQDSKNSTLESQDSKSNTLENLDSNNGIYSKSYEYQDTEGKVKIDISVSQVPLDEYVKRHIVENRLDNMNVYALAPSAYLLAQGHMLSTPLYQKLRASGSITEYKDVIFKISEQSGVQWQLIAAVIMVESGFRVDAKSNKGAIGLMQLMPETMLDLKVTDPLDPYENVGAGATYLKQQILKFKNLDLALAAYNAGPANVKKYKGIPPFAESQNFVQKVRYFYHHFQTKGLQK